MREETPRTEPPGTRVRDASRRRSQKLTVLLAAGAAAVAILSFVASASFSNADTSSTQADTGRMALGLGETGNVDLAGEYAPGDARERILDLGIGNEAASIVDEVTLTTTSSANVTSMTDTTDGFKVWISRCSVAWTESGSGSDVTYGCSGAQSNVLGTSGSPVPVLQTDTPLTGLDLADDAKNLLKIVLTLPASAPNTMANQATNLTFRFDGAQRDGVQK